MRSGLAEPPRRSHVGTVSLLVALGGAAAARLALAVGPFAGRTWLGVVAAGFEAGVVGGLADWFAVTALFRHPLGLPFPHTAIIPTRRARLIQGIVSTVESQWLSPAVIARRLDRVAPSRWLIEWLRDPEHVARIGDPLRDLVRGLARSLTQPELVDFAERTLSRQLRELPLDPSAGRWLTRAAESPAAGDALRSLVLSLKNLAERPRTAQELHWWLLRSARALRASGQRFVPFLLRRKVVQRTIVEAALRYASAELAGAAEDAEHPLRRFAVDGLRGFADRLAAGDAEAVAQVERVRAAILESLETGPLVRRVLERLRRQLEEDLEDRDSRLSRLIDEKLHAAVLGYLEDAAHRDSFDAWVRETAVDLVRRHHHQIGVTVRENLETLTDDQLVEQIESRVGADLQFIRLNGAVVGGLIGVLLALAHLALGG
ncbi:MAG: DUF445 domain-containing protein [Deltaproteobacteria bacterium]|nr:DUF445 domain-containing protein [Deltaproteobacteria bacterium]